MVFLGGFLCFGFFFARAETAVAFVSVRCSTPVTLIRPEHVAPAQLNTSLSVDLETVVSASPTLDPAAGGGGPGGAGGTQ